jgi:hypothetical protein
MFKLPKAKRMDAQPGKHWFCLCVHKWQSSRKGRPAEVLVLTRGRWQLVRRLQEQYKPLNRVPSAISRLGRNPQEYAIALMKLAQQGCEAAALALRQLKTQAGRAEAEDVRAALKLIAQSGAVPVDLNPMAQWKTDSFGLIALQLVLWVWRERNQPHRWRARCLPIWRGWGRWEMLEPQFDRESEKHWYFLARHDFRDTYPHPERLPEFKALVTATKSLKSERLTHSYIVNRIHQRFRSFSAFLGQ